MPHNVPRRERSPRLLAVVAVALGAVFVLTASAFASYASAMADVDRTLLVQRRSDEWLVALLDAETGARGYIVSGRPVFLEPYDAALKREGDLARALGALVAGDAEQAANVAAANVDAHAGLEELRALVDLARAGQRDVAVARLERGEQKKRMDAFRAEVARVRDVEERSRRAHRADARTRVIVALGGAFLLGLAAGGALLLAWRRERNHDEVVTRMAREARERLRALSTLAGALSGARTRQEVADAVIAHAHGATGADICTLYALDDRGEALELLAQRGVVPGVLAKIRRITATEGNPASFAQTKGRTSVWVESEADYAKMYPDIARVPSDGARAKAFWSVPLVAEDRTLGLLGAGYHAPRTMSADERSFIETIASHCAQALLRALHREGEDEARRWFTTTLRSIGDAVIATDEDGSVAFMNPVAEGLTGWREDDARGRPLDEVFSIFSEQTHARVESPVTKVLREGAIVGLANHTVLRSKGGVERPIDDSGAPIRDAEGTIVGVVLVFRDATKEKRARERSEFLAKAGEALVASLDYEATLATVARFAVPTLADWCAVDVIDPSAGRARQVAVAHVDPAKVEAARQLGERYPPDPAAKTGVPEVLRTGVSLLYEDIPEAMIEVAARDADHLRMLRELRLRSAMIVPLRTRGRTVGAMTFIHAESERRYTADDLRFAEDFARRAAMAIDNATALREAEEARSHELVLRHEAELASRAKDEFLATVSHELRTPLNAILGWTIRLRQLGPSADMDRALAIVERNARAQTKLIEDVLDVSRVIGGKLALNLGPANVNDAIAAAIDTVTPAAEAKGIHLEADLPASPITFVADADRLQQIAWNLLSNAVKFTPKGGRVAVRARAEGSEVRIEVKDTGEGMRREVLAIVFEPFRQADASTTRRHGGLGLGLAIVKQLVTAHGGSVSAESEGEGRGATFVVRLPLRSAVPAVGKIARRKELEPARPPGDVAPRLDGLRVLVVDDEEDARRLVAEVLRDQGAAVTIASSAREALDLLAGERPDVLVSDIGMPTMDGLSLVRSIRALPVERGGRTPALALTAYASAEDAQRAFAAGFQRHVAKPVEPAELVTVVANLGGRILDGP